VLFQKEQTSVDDTLPCYVCSLWHLESHREIRRGTCWRSHSLSSPQAASGCGSHGNTVAVRPGELRTTLLWGTLACHPLCGDPCVSPSVRGPLRVTLCAGLRYQLSSSPMEFECLTLMLLPGKTCGAFCAARGPSPQAWLGHRTEA
jgi:hypothetical protein